MRKNSVAVSSSVGTIPSLLFSAIQVVGASFVLALCAQIKIPLYFTPVPLTLQTFAILLIGGFLGPHKGVAAALLYLAEGSLGLPVFSGWTAGIQVLLGAKGGYLLGFLFQAYFAGWFIENYTERSLRLTIAAFLCALLLPLSLGTLWLSHFVGIHNAFSLGFYPFIIGEVLKSIVAARCLVGRPGQGT